MEEDKKKEMLEKILSILKENELTCFEAVKALEDVSSMIKNSRFI